MDAFILDPLYRRTELVDWFESFIWTERWAGWGDFEISIRSTRESRTMFTIGTFISMNASYRVMRVETVENAVDSSGMRVLKVKGRSIETILEDRATRKTYTAIDSTPQEAIRTLLAWVISANGGIFSLNDRISNLKIEKHPSMPTSNVAFPIEKSTKTYPASTLYDIVKDLTNIWDMGFRMLLDVDTGLFYYDTYMGTDRTASQTTRNSVLFSPELENLQNTREFKTNEGSKNVAQVYSKNSDLEVFAPNTLPDISGFDRRVLIVVDESIDLPAGPECDAAMAVRGREALAEHRPMQAFDGEISQASQYIYNKDYYLGDLVEIRDEDGVANQMRVTEQIFVSDKEGDRTYPTLELNTFIGSGSWLSWPTDKKWIDYDTDTETVWGILP